MTSFRTETQIFDPRWSWFFVPTLANYTAVIRDGHIDRYLGNSIAISVGVHGMTLALAPERVRFGALPLSRRDRRSPTGPCCCAPYRRRSWRARVRHLERVGHRRHRSGCGARYTALNLPFTIWLMYGFIEQVPEELEEAAAIDGCGPFEVFWRIILPLVKPGLAAAAIFTFRLAWNEFILSFILTNRYTRTLPASISNYITDTGVEWGKIMAAGVLIACRRSCSRSWRRSRSSPG